MCDDQQSAINQLTQQREVLETLLQSLAITCGSYYEDLMKARLPPLVAQRLVVDFHARWLQHAIK